MRAKEGSIVSIVLVCQPTDAKTLFHAKVSKNPPLKYADSSHLGGCQKLFKKNLHNFASAKKIYDWRNSLAMWRSTQGL